jgi:hypothetical protein
MAHEHSVPIWFFIGILLLVYGFLIAGAGILGWTTAGTHGTQLSELHADVWWGGLMLALGAWYAIKFRPSNK